MAKLGLLATLTAIIGVLTFASMSPSSADDKKKSVNDCKRQDYKTDLVKQACEKGGQKEAKAVMQVWNKEKKIKSCNQCHTNLAPKYELKKDAYEQFTKLGGKLLEEKKADKK
jgi:hypothetical protein